MGTKNRTRSKPAKDPITRRRGGRKPQVSPKVAFRNMKKGEPLAVTKERIDRVKGFTDTLKGVGDPIGFVKQFQRAKDPTKLFSKDSKGRFHTPALKTPDNPTFKKNRPGKRVIGRAISKRKKK